MPRRYVCLRPRAVQIQPAKAEYAIVHTHTYRAHILIARLELKTDLPSSRVHALCLRAITLHDRPFS